MFITILAWLMFGLSIMLCAVSTLGRLSHYDWWIRACEFPRVQIAAVAFILVVGGLLLDSPQMLGGVALSQWTWALGLIVLIYQLSRILPWTRWWPTQMEDADGKVSGEHCVTLLVANVLTPNRNSEGLINQVKQHQPDILLVVESDLWWQSKLDEAFGDWHSIVRVPQDNLYGMHLYSRLPLEDAKVHYLIEDDIPSIRAWVKLPGGKRVCFYALHPRPPAPNESEESLCRDSELLLVGQQVYRDKEPAIVAGDLNDVAWSRTTRLFRRTSGMLDPRRGRGMFNTFHAGYWFMRWPLDHVFCTEHFLHKRMQRLDYFGSDHFPILATLCFRPSESDRNDTPSADSDERDEARDIIDDGQQLRKSRGLGDSAFG
ncbi:MAG: endonuclease/exonuclease/phosphatase family protein [Pseudomonadota bacterium]|nr:endonuclease/exonuclease/phosphatase family protein [Pseudomonadota bacterium]